MREQTHPATTVELRDEVFSMDGNTPPCSSFIPVAQLVQTKNIFAKAENNTLLDAQPIRTNAIISP